MLPFLLLLAGVLYVISESFAFKPMSRLAQVGIPTYSMVMAALTLARDPSQFMWLLLAVPVGVLIGWLQTTHVQVRLTGAADKHHRRMVEVRRGWTYAAGWVLVFVAGIGFHVLLQGAMPWDEILEDLARDVERDLFTILLFTSGLSWYVYALSGTASYTYALILRLRDIHVAEALHEAPRRVHGRLRVARSPVQRFVDWTWRRRGATLGDDASLDAAQECQAKPVAPVAGFQAHSGEPENQEHLAQSADRSGAARHLDR